MRQARNPNQHNVSSTDARLSACRLGKTLPVVLFPLSDTDDHFHQDSFSEQAEKAAARRRWRDRPYRRKINLCLDLLHCSDAIVTDLETQVQASVTEFSGSNGLNSDESDESS